MQSVLKAVCCVFVFNIIFCVYVAQSDEKCDYTFGDPSWNYSHQFYDANHEIPRGNQSLEVVLPKTDGEMVSFVCVNLKGVDKSEAVVEYIALFIKVTVHLNEPAVEPVGVHIVAKEHGY